MAIPIDSVTLNNIVSGSFHAQRPMIVDNFFASNPLLTRLYARNKHRQKGGTEIRTSLIYTDLGGGSYGKGDTFDTSLKEFATALVHQWKRNYAPLAMDNLDQAMNEGAARIIDMVDAMIKTGQLTLANNMGKQIFGDTTSGAGNGGKDLDGLNSAIAQTGSYGGITRGTDAIGTAVKSGNDDTTGGAFTLPMINTAFGNCTIANEAPDMIVTTQSIWNSFWARLQPQQQFLQTDNDLAKAGFRNFQFNGADVVVDSHVPSGNVYLLNSRFWDFWVMEGKDFYLRGPFDVYNQDAWVGQLIVYGNLVCSSPRLNGRIQNVS